VLAVPFVLGWMVLTVITTVFVPSLEKVGEAQAVSMNAHDAPAFIAMQRIGANFEEFDSDSNAMVILEGDKPLGDEAHHYYDDLIKAFEADPEHIEHIADFWSDPLTAAGAQSSDGKSAYVQLYLRGNMGETRANESIAAVREIIEKTPAPPGVKSYVTGGAALSSDQRVAGDKGAAKATLVTLVVIFAMLLVVYRSAVTTILILLMVFVELGAARGIVAFLGNSGVIGLSTFATSLLTLIAIAAGTDYAIFLIGRYQEARGDGEDSETAYYTMFHGTAMVWNHGRRVNLRHSRAPAMVRPEPSTTWAVP
jgi:RND superfamily putative drug exporter